MDTDSRLRLSEALARAASPATPPPQGLAAAQAAWDAAASLLPHVPEAAAAVDEARAWLGVHLMRLGRHAESLTHIAAALPRLQAPGQRALRREALRSVTLSSAELGDFSRGLEAAHELLRLSQVRAEADDPRAEREAALTATYGLAVCLERMGDSWQALRLLEDALTALDDQQVEPDRALLLATNAVCAIGIGMAHGLLGTDDTDELARVLALTRQHGERALAVLQAVPDVAYGVAVPGNLGEALLLQGDGPAAQALLQLALQRAQAHGLQAHGWRVCTTLVDAARAAGDAAGAWTQAQDLLAELAAAGSGAPQQTVIRAHHAAYRAARALGDAERALHHLEVAERLERQRTNTQLRSQSQLFVTRSEIDRARAHAAEMAAAAERDALTGLGNRSLLDRRWRELAAPAAASAGASAVGPARPVTLAVMDLDHFKAVNDRHGHVLGDRVLVQVAQLLRESTRAGDLLVRMGGEEFVVLLPGMALEPAREVFERLRRRIAGWHWHTLAPGLAVTASIGLAEGPGELATLLQEADAAMYRAKGAGRDRVVG